MNSPSPMHQESRVNWIQILQSQFKRMFKIVKPLGQGSYGLVYLAENYEGCFVALKQYKQIKYTRSADQQALTMSLFYHQNILKLYGTFRIKESSKLILVTQYCQKASLKDYILNVITASQIFKTKMCLQIAQGIQQMHRKNIMHRDLKPQNILIDYKLNMKICDFGFGKLQISKNNNSQDVGTPLYRDPNVQKRNYSKKCDVYSLGLIIFYIFKGQNLFQNIGSNYELKDSQKRYFSNKLQSLSKSKLSDEILQIIQNTVTQKQEDRLTSQQLRVKLQRYKQRLTPSLNIQQIVELKNENKGSIGKCQQLYSMVLLKCETLQKSIKQKQTKRKYISIFTCLKKNTQYLKQLQNTLLLDQYEKIIASLIIILKYSIVLKKHLSNMKQQIKDFGQSSSKFQKLIQGFSIQQKRCRFPIKKFAKELKSYKTIIRQKITQNLNFFISNTQNVQYEQYPIQVQDLDQAYNNLLQNCRGIKSKEDRESLALIYKKIES